MSTIGAAVAPSGGQNPLLTFGVELELVLKPLEVARDVFSDIFKENSENSISIFAKILAESVQLENFSCLAEGTPEYTAAKNNNTLMNNWLVVVDGTVTSDSGDCKLILEVFNGTMAYGRKGAWN